MVDVRLGYVGSDFETLRENYIVHFQFRFGCTGFLILPNHAMHYFSELNTRIRRTYRVVKVLRKHWICIFNISLKICSKIHGAASGHDNIAERKLIWQVLLTFSSGANHLPNDGQSRVKRSTTCLVNELLHFFQL